MGGINFWGYSPKGAFYKSSEESSYIIYFDEVYGKIGETLFDASIGETKIDGTFKNDVYGKSDHLQTNNITVKYWKRIA